MEDYEVDAMTVRRVLKGLHGGNPLARFDPGAIGYVSKPVDYPQFVDATRATDPCRTLSELPQ